MNYTYIGQLDSGEDIYISTDGNYVVEKDHCILVTATEEEIKEIKGKGN